MSAPTELSFTILDVFTSTKYLGNPLAVVFVPPDLRTLPQDVKQCIAREFNLSETVFVHQRGSSFGSAREIDIFTVTRELPFAGHPTIGTASLVLKELQWKAVKTLMTKAGPIGISLDTDGASVKATIPHDVHIHRGTLGGLPATKALIDSGCLGHGGTAILEAELAAPVVSIVKGMTFVLVRLPDLEHLAKVEVGNPVDFDRVGGLLDDGPWKDSFVTRYYYVKVEDGTIRTRMVELGFEDPATGSAACTLAAYLTETSPAPKTTPEAPLQYKITQGVEIGRKSDMTVDVLPRVDEKGQLKVKELYLGGEAVVVMRGTLTV